MATRACLNASLAKITHQQMTAIRGWLAKEDFIEIFPPHLTGIRERPFMKTFKVSSPELKFEGALRVSANYFLAETVSQIKRAYAITSSFRPGALTGTEADRFRLLEFQLGELWREGDFGELLEFSERLLSNTISALLGENSLLPLARAKELEKIRFPLPRIPYKKAMEEVGGKPGQQFTPQQQLALVSAHGSSPVFVTHFPTDLAPTSQDLSDMRRDSTQRVLSFDLFAPFGGEIMTGGQLETDRDTLTTQMKESRFLRELVAAGGTYEQVEPYIAAVSRLDSPYVRMGFGFERLSQFLMGTEGIDKATYIPLMARRRGGVIIIIIDGIIIIGLPEPEPI